MDQTNKQGAEEAKLIIQRLTAEIRTYEDTIQDMKRKVDELEGFVERELPKRIRDAEEKLQGYKEELEQKRMERQQATKALMHTERDLRTKRDELNQTRNDLDELMRNV